MWLYSLSIQTGYGHQSTTCDILNSVFFLVKYMQINRVKLFILEKYSHQVATMDSSYTITKLNSENYFSWKLKVEMLLREQGIWEAVSAKKPDPENDEWKSMDEKARATIILLVEDNQLQHVRGAQTAAEAWKSLQVFYQSTGNRSTLMRSIISLKAREGDNIESHVQQMTDLFQRLVAVDSGIMSSSFMAAILLVSLPDSYKDLIISLRYKKEEELTTTYVASKIIEAYRRRTEREKDSEVDGAFMMSKKFCKYCKIRGHAIDECRKKAKPDQNKRVAIAKHPDEFLFTIGNAHSAQHYMIDIAASRHFTGQKDHYISFDPQYRASVQLVNGEIVQAMGIGDIMLMFVNDTNQTTSTRINDVLFVPEIGRNSLSVSQLTARGLSVQFSSGQCIIRRGHTNIAIADQDECGFALRTNATTH